MTSLKEFLKRSLTVTPSDVIHVFDPFDRQVERTQNQAKLVQSAKRGIARHQQTGLEITHQSFLINDLPPHIADYIHQYPPQVSRETTKSINLDQNVTLKATSDYLIGDSNQCLCLEIKPGTTGRPYGGIQGRYLLQAALNGLTVSSDQDFPDVAIYLYNSGKLAVIDQSHLDTVLPQVRQMAVSAGKIQRLDQQQKLLKRAGTIRRQTKDGQQYLFYPDQFSTEYRAAQEDIPEIRQLKMIERRKFDTCFDDFNHALKQLFTIK